VTSQFSVVLFFPGFSFSAPAVQQDLTDNRFVFYTAPTEFGNTDVFRNYLLASNTVSEIYTDSTAHSNSIPGITINRDHPTDSRQTKWGVGMKSEKGRKSIHAFHSKHAGNGELVVAAFAGTAGILHMFFKIGAFFGNVGAFMAINTIHLFSILFHSLMNFIQLFVPKGERANEHSGDHGEKEHVFHDYLL
jgi:hypothetical protein